MKAKKSLGQNFLKSEPALRKIIEAGEIKKDDLILEIGPGRGALTEKILQKAGKVFAIEKDRELFEFLKSKFEKEIEKGNLILINKDILEFEMEQNYKIIANIPYNITGAILKKFLTEKNQPERMILMVQHEVAQRIVGRGGKESILSISVKAYGEPKMVMKVPARYFSPAPKVDSAIIEIKNISRKLFLNPENSPLEEYPLGGGGYPLPDPSPFISKMERGKQGVRRVLPPRSDPGRSTPQEGNNEENFWKIVKMGFAHKRKKLSGNLKDICQGESLTHLGYADKRAEDLSLKDWLVLAKM